MSLDVYLELEGVVTEPGSGIFVRENGKNVEISVEEWNSRNPGREPLMVSSEINNIVYHGNITHNLSKMAKEADLYEYLWRPDEHGIKKAGELILALVLGIKTLASNPEKFKEFNPSNGWGDYDGFLQFVVEYFHACSKYPEANVSVSR